MASDRSARIAALNDRLRASLVGRAASHPRQTIMLSGALASELQAMTGHERTHKEVAILSAISEQVFVEGDNPYGERDYGSFAIEGEEERLFWKVDYYDHALTEHSPDATDPAVTNYVLTIAYMRDY